MQVLILVLFIFSALPLKSASAAAAIQQQQALQQRRRQQEIQQRIMQQQQQQAIAAQQQAYNQALAQRQQMVQQATQRAASIAQQQALQQRAYNQAITQQAVNAGAAQRAAYNQAQQALSQIQPPQAQYQQQMAQDGVLMSDQNRTNQGMYQQPVNIPSVNNPAYGDLIYTPPVEEVVNITDIWKEMETHSNAWALMIDMEPKMITVQRMIDHFKTKGISINKGPAHYVQMIDSMSFQNPQLLDQPFENILKIIAIIEYDFSNGQSKDQLARQIFQTDEQFKQNKKRLGL